MVDGGSDVTTTVAAPRWAAMMRQRHRPADLNLLDSRPPAGVTGAWRDRGHGVQATAAIDPLFGHSRAVEAVRDELASYAPRSRPLRLAGPVTAGAQRTQKCVEPWRRRRPSPSRRAQRSSASSTPTSPTWRTRIDGQAARPTASVSQACGALAPRALRHTAPMTPGGRNGSRTAWQGSSWLRCAKATELTDITAAPGRCPHGAG